MEEISGEKWWNEIGGRRKREKPREKPTQTPFRPPRNPHGVTETRTRDSSGGRREPSRLRHEAAYIFINCTKYFNIWKLFEIKYYTILVMYIFCTRTIIGAKKGKKYVYAP